MHIKINKLSILRIVLLSFMFIYGSSAFADTTSKYIEDVKLPECDATNPEVQFIKTNADWNTINNSSKRIFCVKPGDYSGAENITLTESGTSSSRRYIILDDGRETHPAKLQPSEQANVRISLNGASYWTVDRLSSLDIPLAYDEEVFNLYNGSSFNIFNRINIDGFNRAWYVAHQCHNNVLQNSRVANQTLKARKSDQVAVGLATRGVNNCQIFNTKITNNEITNVLDGIQLIVVNVSGTNYEGTIIDSNKIWNEPSMYLSWNGSGWTSDVNGMFSYSENAMDFKAGSANPNNPIIVTNNAMWGWRKQAGSTQFNGDPGTAVTLHEPINNFIFERNVMFDSYSAIESISTTNSMSIKHNIIYDCYKQPATYNRDGLYIYYATNLKFENNTIVDTTNGKSINLANNRSGLTFNNNLVISSGYVTGSARDSETGNYYYDTSSGYAGTGGGIAANANMTDLVISYDNFTTSPKSKTLTGVLSTPTSPHYGVAGVLDVLVGTTTAETTIVEGPWIMYEDTLE